MALTKVQNRCSHETAAKLLHLASRSSNRRLHDIAEDILHHASDIPVITGGEEK